MCSYVYIIYVDMLNRLEEYIKNVFVFVFCFELKKSFIIGTILIYG